MGNLIIKDIYIPGPDVPVPNGPPTFDPNYGFPKGRKPREMKMSEEDMMALKIPRDQRDYCAHKYLEIQRCKRRHFPLMIKCSNEIHEYHQCNADEYIIRMKEYERERRLLQRQKRIQEAAAA